jgi:hypothetical protein|tara:strand:- start:12 stop:197 length:186 start_codon:yes stop_codon:yes gene_type:complete
MSNARQNKTPQDALKAETDPYNQGFLVAKWGGTLEDNPHKKDPDSESCKRFIRGFHQGKPN